MKRGYRPRLRDVVQRNRDLLVAMGAPAEKIDAIRVPLPKQRTTPRLSDPADTEGPVASAIAELLARHPKVLFAVRQNGGAFTYDTKDGRSAPVWFYRILTGSEITITDFWGLLKDGRPFAIEAKRPSWKEPKLPREFKQAAFIMLMRNIGGKGGFATSVEEAAAILDS